MNKVEYFNNKIFRFKRFNANGNKKRSLIQFWFKFHHFQLLRNGLLTS